MLPVIFASNGESGIIKKIGGSGETKQHLLDLGFVPGGEVTVVSRLGGNIILSIKGVRVAISEELAKKIFI